MFFNPCIKIKIGRNFILQYLFLYLLLMSHGTGLYVSNILFFRCIIFGISVVYFFLSYKKKNNLTIYLLILSIYILLREGGQLLLNYYESILVLYGAYNIDRKMFCSRFVNICAFFAIVSIPYYILGLVNPVALLNWVGEPYTVEGYDFDFYGWILYTARPRVEVNELLRNNSIYAEPGITQMLLNSSLFIILFMEKYLHGFSSKKITFFTVLFVMAVITSGSTTGYIGMALIIATYILYENKRKLRNEKFEIFLTKINKKLGKKIIFVFAIVIIALAVQYCIYQEESLVYQFVISKTTEMFLEGTSGHARTKIIEVASEVAISNFFGVGDSTFMSILGKVDKGANGAILIHSFASLGIVPTILILSYFYKRIFKSYIPLGNALLIIALYVNTELAQSRLLYPSLIMLPIIYANYCKIYFCRRILNGK